MQFKCICLFILAIKMTIVCNSLNAQDYSDNKLVLQPYLTSSLAANTPYKEMYSFSYGGGTYAYYNFSPNLFFGVVFEYSRFNDKEISEDFIKISYPKLSLISYGLSSSMEFTSGVFLHISGGYTTWLSEGSSNAMFVSPSLGFTKNSYGVMLSLNSHFGESQFNNTLNSVGVKLFKKIKI